MTWQDFALCGAGIIGSGVAVVHGLLLQRRMVRPLDGMLGANDRTSPAIKRLVPVLLQFSTFNWFLGGLFLIAAARWAGPEAKLWIALLVGSSYLFGAIGNAWATGGRHPGWALYAIALCLIGVGIG